MAGEPVVTPPLDASATIFVDWLELIAFFNEFGIARLDVLQGALAQQEDEPEDDIGKRDQGIEKLIESIENEVADREAFCSGSYPFILTDDAEELQLKNGLDSEEYSFYLVCLLTTHLTRDSLFDFQVDDELTTRLRNRVFQVISTFAMAGLAGGSAASIGWPRERKPTVLQTLKRAEMRGAGFVTFDEPGEYTPPGEKDGGIDIISWSTTDRPPPTILFYAQVATGHNWKEKPAKLHVDLFEDNYFRYRPRGNKAFATLIPSRETEMVQWINQHTRHGTLLDRTRLPFYAKKGLDLKNEGSAMDEAENIPQVTQWVSDFRTSALDTAA